MSLAIVLPFVSCEQDRITSFWAPDRSGHYMMDCERGRRYADNLIEFIRDTGDVQILPAIATALPEREKFGGVEDGLLSRVADLMLARKPAALHA